MYKCLDNFSCFSGKFFKGGVYQDLPSDKRYHNRFLKIEAKEEKQIVNTTVETATRKRKHERR